MSPINVPLGTKVLMGIRNGTLIVVDPMTERYVSLPWPPPAPKHSHGSWQPAKVGTNEDGSPVLLWGWEDDREGRSDDPPPEAA